MGMESKQNKREGRLGSRRQGQRRRERRRKREGEEKGDRVQVCNVVFNYVSSNTTGSR